MAHYPAFSTTKTFNIPSLLYGDVMCEQVAGVHSAQLRPFTQSRCLTDESMKHICSLSLSRPLLCVLTAQT